MESLLEFNLRKRFHFPQRKNFVHAWIRISIFSINTHSFRISSTKHHPFLYWNQCIVYIMGLSHYVYNPYPSVGRFWEMCVRAEWHHDDVIKWKYFPRYCQFVRGIHRSPVNSPHKGQWRGALMFTLICARINVWVNNRKAGDLRRNRVHYDVIVMLNSYQSPSGDLYLSQANT